jgi:hypothetical protein
VSASLWSRRFLWPFFLIVLLVTPPAGASAAADVRVTRDATPGSYVRYDGGTDAVLQGCSSGRRVQVEPTVAVDPRNTDVVVAGAIDRCIGAATEHSAWAGFYLSTDDGATWQDSLVPGYDGDTSPAGLASPAHGSVACGDPTLSFDAGGQVLFAFGCGRPGQNGSLFVAGYQEDGSQYARTVLVDAGTPGPPFTGATPDKPNLVVDQTTGPGSGNVYVAWTRVHTLHGGEWTILFSRSTDRGATFSSPQIVAAGAGAAASFGRFNISTDMAVGPDGTVYLVWQSNISPGVPTSVFLARSTDYGRSFGKSQVVATIAPFVSSQFSGFPSDSDVDSRACGLLFPCPSGLTFARFASNPSVAADATGVHVVWSAERGDGQAKIFVRNSPDGLSFPTPPQQLDAVPVGHQWFPDLASADGILRVVFYDSRIDPAYSPSLPPGDTADGLNSGDVVDAWTASSTDGGRTWSEERISDVSFNPNWNTGPVPFFGDYIYLSAVSGRAWAVWTDARDLLPGLPAIFLPFFPCDPFATDQTDPCFSAGGLDVNIYARALN